MGNEILARLNRATVDSGLLDAGYGRDLHLQLEFAASSSQQQPASEPVSQ